MSNQPIRLEMKHFVLSVFVCACTAPVFAANMTPTSQDRQTYVFVSTICEGEQAQGESAANFEPFESNIGIFQNCDVENTFGWSNAEHDSTISNSSFVGGGSAIASGETPEELSVAATSSFRVTFELTSASIFQQAGSLSVQGGGQYTTIYASASLTGPEYNQDVFDHFLVGGNGLNASEQLTPTGILAPGTYTYRVESLVFSGDIVQLSPEAQANYGFSFEVSTLGDLNGDDQVNVNDLLILIGRWGPCPKGQSVCAADLNLDGQINVNDLLLLIANWG